jgi:hypothetical protein
MGENAGAERAVPTTPTDMQPKKGEPKGMPSHEGGMMHGMTNAHKVPGYPADMMDMMGVYSESEVKKLNKPETRGMRRNWFAGIEALHTVVRVLPPQLYDKVVSGEGNIEPGASVPGGTSGTMTVSHGHGH